MPSDKQRVNLTIPDEIYKQLQKYKKENGFYHDASACMSLIVKRLREEGYHA